jgi:hypothetical protein
MRAPLELLAELRSRNLFDQAEQIAARYHVHLADICTPSRRSDVVAARHAIWLWQIDELGSQIAVARLWGVDHTTVMSAEAGADHQIVRVLLDVVGGYRFEWIGDRIDPFLITGDGERRPFAFYASARTAWIELLERAGLSTFRSHSLDDEPAAPPPHPPPSEPHSNEWPAADGGAP